MKEEWGWTDVSDTLKSMITDAVYEWFRLCHVFTGLKETDVNLNEQIESLCGECVKTLMVQYANKTDAIEVVYIFEDADFSEVIQQIVETFDLKTEYVSAKVHKNIGGRHSEWIETISLCSLYEWLDNMIQTEDCKNGTRICKQGDEYYFSIVGSNYYTSDDTYLGTNEVKIYFKEFVW